MANDKKKSDGRAERQYPGVAVDSSDSGRVTKKLMDERTCALNNNPRTGEHDADPAAPPRDN